MLRFIRFLVLIAIAVTLTSCISNHGGNYSTSNNTSGIYTIPTTTSIVPSVSTSKLGKLKTITVEVKCDYGQYMKNKTTLLLEDSLVFFNPDDYGITLYVGAYVEIEYYGEWIVQTSYPSRVDTSSIIIHNIRLVDSNIIEYEIGKDSQNNTFFKTDDDRYENAFMKTLNVINEDGSYTYYETLEKGDIVYGVNPIYYSSLAIVALYSYPIK